MVLDKSQFSGPKLLIFAVILLFAGFLLGSLHYNINFFSFAQDDAATVYQGEDRQLERPEDAINQARQVERAFAYASQKARPAVVTIFTRKEVSVRGFPFRTPRGREPFDEFFRRFFEGPESRSREVTGLGSGLIISSDGYILTNHHVVAKADEIEIMLNTRETVKARIVGQDKSSDLAVLKIDREGLPTLDFADSDELKVGEYALAIGSPFQMRNSVSVGHVSALHRSINVKRFEDLIQTDAAINQGNSGGPLVGIEGDVIGINTLILSQGSKGSQGVGFAISSNLASRTAKDLIEYGEVRRPWLGVMIQEVTSEMAKQLDAEQGVIVAEVKEGSPAQEAGLEPGDVILEFDGKEVQTPHDLQRFVLAREIDEKVTLKFKDKTDGTKEVTVELAKLPSDTARSGSSPSLERGGQLDEKLGLSLRRLSKDQARERGIVPPRPVLQVTEVQRGSPAASAELEKGDLILRVVDEPVTSKEELNKILMKLKEQGKGSVPLLVRRESNFYTSLPLGK